MIVTAAPKNGDEKRKVYDVTSLIASSRGGGGNDRGGVIMLGLGLAAASEEGGFVQFGTGEVVAGTAN